MQDFMHSFLTAFSLGYLLAKVIVKNHLSPIIGLSQD